MGAILPIFFVLFGSVHCPAQVSEDEVRSTICRAAEYYTGQVSNHGGYVYFYSLDLKTRWGEGPATIDQIWVQPPGTPTVGMAFLEAYRATGDQLYLQAATSAAHALIHGQLKSGGWTNCIEFDPRGKRQAAYRNGRGKGKNNSSLDDGQTQSALRFLVLADAAGEFQDPRIHEAAEVGLRALLAAQFSNGAFPQVWTGPVEAQPIRPAQYPTHDWRTEGRIKNYWDMYTLNDNVAGYVTELLVDAYRVYEDERFLNSLKRLGDFLVLAQLPQPQPGWAQQYNYEMQPIWARKFEPAAVAGDETQEAIRTLLTIYQVTGDAKYLRPIPAALKWLRASRLRDGRLARYYELHSNRPLYMYRTGDKYHLTYDDSRLPKHYGWKIESTIDELEKDYRRLRVSREPEAEGTPDARQVARIVASLDATGRWVDTYRGERLVGQPKFALRANYLSSETFSRNLTTLSRFLLQDER